MHDLGLPTVGGPAGFRIRPASGLDAEAMLSLIQSHASYEGGQASVTAVSLRSALDRQPSPLSAWLAEQADGVVGYATATSDFSTWAGRPFLHLDCLFVQDGCRGSGIGAALLETVRAYASTLRIAELKWQTPDWNKDAKRFYLREGASCLPKTRFTLPIA